MKILVVDDDAMNRLLFASVLRERGHEVWEACDGEEALTMIEREPVTLVLMDVVLPKTSGVEVLRRCRKTGSLNGKKVFALTGNVTPEILEAGFDGVLMKPVRIMELLELVEGGCR